MKPLSSYITNLQPSLLKAEKKAKREPFVLFPTPLTNEDWERVKTEVRDKSCPYCGKPLKAPLNNKKIVMCKRKAKHPLDASGRSVPYILTPKGYKILTKD